MPTLSPTIRERIIREIVTSLGASNVDLYGLQDWKSVQRGRVDYEPGEVPFITVNPGQDTATRTQYGRQTMKMEVGVIAIYPTDGPAVTSDASPSELAEIILGTLIQAVMAGTTALKALIDDLAYTRGGVGDYPDETQQMTVVEAYFTVTYRIAKGDPYNQ
ncbi:MAG: hypothetical protein ACLGQH_09770 [Acidobacteriota bacterium]